MNNDPGKIRVQDDRLTLSNLMEYPAWEYALDEEEVEGQDERTVRPYLAPPPLDINDTYFLVRASFVFADGSYYKGYMVPKSLDTVDKEVPFPTIIPYDLRPMIVLDNEQIYFQYGPEKPSAEDLQQFYDLFGKTPDEVFPIKFSSDIEVLKSVTEGQLDGFMYFDKYVSTFAMVKSLRSSDIRFAK
jgi:hypothetical protein